MRNTRIEPMFSALPKRRHRRGTVRYDRKGQYRQIYPGRTFPHCPCRSDINLFGNGEGVVDLNAEVSDGALDLGVAEQELDSPQIACASIDQGCLCPPEGMRTEDVWVQPDAGSPLGDKPGVLPCRHRLFLTAPAGKQDLARLSSRSSEVVIDSLPGLFGQFEPDGLSGLLLPHCRAIDDITPGSNIFDFQSDDIASAQLAIDGEIEHRQITQLASYL